MISATFGMPIDEVEDLSFGEVNRLVRLAVWYEGREATATDPRSAVLQAIADGTGNPAAKPKKRQAK